MSNIKNHLNTLFLAAIMGYLETRSKQEQPSISLMRTKQLLDFLVNGCYPEKLTPENEEDKARINRRYVEYIMQVVDFTDTACQYLAYNDLDVPQELADYVTSMKGKLHHARQTTVEEVLNAKVVVARALNELKQI